MTAAPKQERASRLRTYDLGELMRSATAAERPELFHRSDGESLLYRGAVHELHSEPNGGKTWLGLAGVADMLDHGERAVFVDYEGRPAPTAERLRALGCDPDHVSSGLVYVQPDGALELSEVDHLRRLADGADVVIIDSLGEALAAAGRDENAASDVTWWFSFVARPLAHDGAALLVLDHVVKAVDSRGRWARGSSAKLGAVDAGFELRLHQSFSRRGSGRAELIVSKDRGGAVGAVGDVAAVVSFNVRQAGEEMRIRLDPPPDDYGAGSAKQASTSHVEPEDVARAIRQAGGYWPSRRAAADALGLSTNTVGRPLSATVRAGYLSEEPGPHGGSAYRLVDEQDGQG